MPPSCTAIPAKIRTHELYQRVRVCMRAFWDVVSRTMNVVSRTDVVSRTMNRSVTDWVSLLHTSGRATVPGTRVQLDVG